MRSTLPPRGRRAQQVLALGAAPALVAGLALVATPAPASTAPEPTAAPSSASTERSTLPYLSKAVGDSQNARTQRVSDYWTPKRMANAVPADNLTRDAVADFTPAAAARTDRMKPATGAKPAQPAGADASRKKLRKSRTIGKVFFKTKRGVNMVCSGSAVNSKGKNMVMTAGHCVNGGKGKAWHKNWIFVPGYGPKNKARNGVYVAKRLVALRGWVRKSRLSADVGLALVKPRRGTKKKLVRNVGGYGTQFGRNFRRKLTAVGYPDSRGFNGSKQRRCRRMTRKVPRLRQIQIRCKVLVPGASGGPWVRGPLRKGKGYVNGVVSTVNAKGKARWNRSPYFGRNVFRMYKAFRNKR